MGLKLRVNLFYGVTAADVRGALKSFYASQGRPLLERPILEWNPDPDPYKTTLEVYEANNNWVVVWVDAGWTPKERREAQIFVSQRLWCSGFLVFVNDGEYWGYEFFDRGQVLDHFIQQEDEAHFWFPDQDCKGAAEVIVERLPFLDYSVIASYLKQKPSYGRPPELKGKVQPGDEFDRFDECAVLDFLRALGIRIELEDRIVTLQSPVAYVLQRTFSQC